MRKYVNVLECGRRNSKIFGGKKHIVLTSCGKHLPCTAILIRLEHIVGRKTENVRGSEEKFTLVAMMDSSRVRQAAEKKQLCTK